MPHLTWAKCLCPNKEIYCHPNAEPTRKNKVLTPSIPVRARIFSTSGSMISPIRALNAEPHSAIINPRPSILMCGFDAHNSSPLYRKKAYYLNYKPTQTELKYLWFKRKSKIVWMYVFFLRNACHMIGSKFKPLKHSLVICLLSVGTLVLY